MKESDVNKIFHGYKKQLIAKLGTKVTDNVELEKIGYAVLGAKFKGVYSQDDLPVRKAGYYIMNTDIASKPGVHWVACVVSPKKIYVFDSFGRKSKKLLPILCRNAKAVNKVVIDTDPDIDQSITAMTCGPISLAFLLTVKQIGITQALKV
jgi:hypothetical protein